MKLFREISLGNGLVITCHNESHHYFGEYHQARVIMAIATVAGTGTESDHDRGVVHFRKTFERMGVRGSDLHRVTGELVDGFMRNVLPYLSLSDFPAKMQSMNEKNLPRHRPRHRPRNGSHIG